MEPLRKALKSMNINLNLAMDATSFNVNFGTTIFTWEPTGLAYDFDSIMHYSAYATASCWPDCPVITYKGTNTPVVTTYHSRGTFSATDIAEINMRYPCDMSQDDTSEDETTSTLVEELETIRMENKQVSKRISTKIFAYCTEFNDFIQAYGRLVRIKLKAQAKRKTRSSDEPCSETFKLSRWIANTLLVKTKLC